MTNFGNYFAELSKFTKMIQIRKKENILCNFVVLLQIGGRLGAPQPTKRSDGEKQGSHLERLVRESMSPPFSHGLVLSQGTNS